LLPNSALSAWQHDRVPGGTPLETIVVNEPALGATGLLVCERAGGLYWLERQGNTWGEYIEFIPYEGIWGGDVHFINGTLKIIAAANSGVFVSDWTGDAWGEFQYISNHYYRYQDAAFFGYNTSNDRYQYVVTAMQQWEPVAQTFIQGLYLVEGDVPLPEGIIPISGPENREYTYIHRDLEPGYENIFYAYCITPGEERFQKLTAEGAFPTWTGSSLVDDFSNADTEEVNAFYQYIDSSATPHVYHQYLIAWTSSHDYYDVWHRSREFGSGGFSSLWAIVATRLNVVFTTPSGGDMNIMGLAAYSNSGFPGGHVVYLLMEYYGLVVNFPPFGWTQLNETPSGDEYIRSYTSRSLNYNTLNDTHDELFVATQYGDLQYALIDRSTFAVESWGDFNNWGFDPSVGAQKMGSPIYSFWKDEANGIIYFPHLLSGIYRYDAMADLWSRLGTNGVSIHENPDYNHGWTGVTPSPFEAGSLLIGSKKFIFGSGPNWNVHGGVYRVSVDGSGGVIPFRPSFFNNMTVTSLAGDDAENLLYSGVLDVVESFTTGKKNPAVDYWVPSELWCTDDGSYQAFLGSTASYVIYTYLNPTTYPHYNSLRLHPVAGITGVIYGIGFLFLDGGIDHSVPLPDNYGGGLEYAYRDEYGIWQTTASNPDQTLVSCYKVTGTNNEPGSWFEHVMDMEVEATGPGLEDFVVLAATGAWPQSHKTEDMYRYGGLFRVQKAGSEWIVETVTPETDDYQLNGNPVGDFTDPSVLSVDKIQLTGSNRYFCYTMGERRYSEDEPLGLIWYQDAVSMGEIEAGNWIKLPNVEGEAGAVPYDATHNFWNPTAQLAALSDVPEEGLFTVAVTGDGPVGPHIYTGTMPLIPGPALSLTTVGVDIVLTWTAIPMMNVYKIYRSEESYFTPSPENLVATVDDTTYTDPGASASSIKYFYVVVGSSE
jgi:hypothetical protein